MTNPHLTPEDIRRNRFLSVKRALQTEAEGMMAMLAALDSGLGEAVVAALELIAKAHGRVIVSGMGKSGHVGRKIAATLASTGTPAQFVHPAEASHGDLGMITPQDVVIILSNSGESAELVDLINYTQRFQVPLIAITAKSESALGRAADVTLLLPQAPEACPNGLAPTTSTLLQLAIGDALSVALLEDKGFTAQHFKVFHPGGKLGSKLMYVKDMMRNKESLPLASQDMTMPEALLVMTEKACGCLGITGSDGHLTGIITDGDLRRHMSSKLLTQTTAEIMTKSPKTLSLDILASEALAILNDAQITSIFVVDADARPIGLVHVHDLLRIGVS